MNQISNLKKVCLLIGLLMPLSLGASGCATAKPKMQVEVTLTIHRVPAQSGDEAESSEPEAAQSDDSEAAAD